MHQSTSFVVEAQDLLLSGRLQQAVEVCKRGLAVHPNQISGYVFLSQAYYSLGQTEKAALVLNDGYRRTGAASLQVLHNKLAGTQPEPTVDESVVIEEVSADEVAAIEVSSENVTAEDVAPEVVVLEEVIADGVVDVQDVAVVEHAPVENTNEESAVAHVADEGVSQEVIDMPVDVDESSVVTVEPKEIPVPAPEPHTPTKVLHIEPVHPRPEPVVVPIAVEPEASVADVIDESSETVVDTSSSVAAPPPLQLHVAQSGSRLRSSNLRLIPGLEFAPLRHNLRDNTSQIRRLIDEPEVPPPSIVEERVEPETPKVVIQEDAPVKAEAPVKVEAPPVVAAEIPHHPPEKLTPLEELARRLENARIPLVEDPERVGTFDSPIVSETLADILVSQGAYAEAIKAFRVLERTKPGRAKYYRQKIELIEHKMNFNAAEDGDG